ncbi:MAG: hypothetical protein CSB03_00540 [Bacteroidia bacterium]|nr:MAG: hypothetical protein CSB03_00540 [Bacteroidia bacterium]
MKVLSNIFNFGKTPKAKADTKPLRSRGKTNPAIMQIVEKFKDNSRKDIDKWRQAIQMAQHPEEPKYTAYFDLIDDLMTDGHLQSQIQMRKMSSMNTDFQVINRKTGEVNEELTFILQQQWFFHFIGWAWDSILFGTSLIEFQSFDRHLIKPVLIPRRHTIPSQYKIVPDLEKENQYILHNNPKLAPWLLCVGDRKDLGIMNNIIPNLIWKRNVAQAWAEFCERFGMPLITATANTSDDKTIDKVHGMLLKLGEASVGTFPPGTDIQFQEANRTDAYNVYKQFIQLNADVISKQLVGSTMLSDQGTNRSQTEVHERSLDDRLAQSDKRMLAFVVNDQLFPLLKLQGYKITDDDLFEFKNAEQEIDLSQMWQIARGLLEKDYEIEQEWLSKTFNIPILGKKSEEKDEGEGEKKKSKANALALKNERYPQCECGQHTIALGGKVRKMLKDLTSDLIEQVYNKKDTTITFGRMIVAEALELLTGLRSGFKTSASYTSPDLLVLQMMEYNVFEFSASKTEARLAAMTDLLIDKEKKELREYEDFKELCLKETKNFNESWLQSEYNLSVAVGQTSAQYLRFMSEKDTVTSFVKYQTAGDNLVRASHQVLDGKIFNLSDKEAMDLWPPNGYGCRCEMLQELLHTTDPKYRNSQFEINRGDLKQVFTKKQFYSDIKGLPEKLNTMTFDKYGLTSYSKMKGKLKPIKLDESITEKNLKELFKPIKGTQKMGFKDYLGRKMTLDKKVFDSHTTGKYLNDNERRHQLFPHIKDILSNPDEVWYNNPHKLKNKFQSRYIKFYKDRMIVIDCNLDDKQGLEIQTWYNGIIKEKDLRKGLKIK